MDNLPVKKSHVVESGSGEGISEETPLINSKEKSINWSSLVLRNVLILLFWIGLSIFDLCKSQLIYKRINDAKTDKINSSSVKCGEVNGSLFEDESQTEASDWVWYLNLSQLCIAIPMIILFGIYSDVYGRRYPLVITLGSTAVLYGCTAMVSVLNLDLHYLYIGFVISGLAGSNSNFLATATASIADVTSPSNTQSIAFAIIYLIAGIGYSSAEFGGGYIVKAYGFTWPLVFASCLCLVGSLLAFLRFTDEFERRGTGFKNVISNLKNVFCNNNHNKDITGHFPVWVFAMILCSLFFFFSVNDTREDIETLMELRSPFCWDAEYIGWFQSAESTMHMLIGPLCILILQKFFIDETIAVLGLVSGMLFYVMFGFAVNDWMIYTGASLGVLCMAVSPCLKASLSKMVPSDGQGSIFAAIYIMDVISTLAGSTVFNNVYSYTQTTMHGMTFLVMAGCNLVALICVTSVMVFKKSDRGRWLASVNNDVKVHN